jgi:hypothetical protein
MELDPGHLHLVVERSRSHPGDVHFCVRQAFKLARIVVLHQCVDISVVRNQLQVHASRIRPRHKVGGSDHGTNGDQHGIVLGANQLVVSGWHRIGQRAMGEQSYVASDHDGAKAVPRIPPNQHPIAGPKFSFLRD